MSESILDKVMDSQKSQVAAGFNPESLLNELFKNLKEREIEVLNFRYGFKQGDSLTLEEIGKKFNVTRERIRQIENSALKKIKKIENLEEILKPIEVIANQTLEEFGGLMLEKNLIKKILTLPGYTPTNRAIIHFILTKLLSEKFHLISSDNYFHNCWKLPTVSHEIITGILDNLVEIIKQSKKPLSAKEIIEKIDFEHLPEYIKDKIDDQIAHSLLETCKTVNTNPFNEWGLAGWNLISLKRMSDKIYLILQKEGKSLHFTEIAQKINEIGFDSKKANPATIHNELILDDKYVLVGRGIYALKEWGYQPGTVADVIEQVLREAGEPLSREEIIERVAKIRMVKRSTIILGLMNKDKFKKNSNNHYQLV